VAGLFSGLVGTIIVMGGFILIRFASPLFDRLDDIKRWSDHPETRIVRGLLHLLAGLEDLECLRKERDEAMLRVLAREKQRLELRQKFMDTSESKKFEQLPDGTFRETYELLAKRDDGSWETVLREEGESPGESPALKKKRQDIVLQAEQLARYIEYGLPAKLTVGNKKIDVWLRQELRGRAQTVRAWAQQVALPSEPSYQGLVSQVGRTIERAVEEQWADIP